LLVVVPLIVLAGAAVSLALLSRQPANRQTVGELPNPRLPPAEGIEEPSESGTTSTTRSSSRGNPFIVPPPPPAPPDRNVSISFPDGTTLAVRLRQFVPAAPPVYSNERLTDVYEDLRRAAEQGHSAAARTLYEMLTTCQYAYADEPSLNAALRRLRTEGVLVFPESVRDVERVQPVPEGLDRAQLENTLTRPYEFCLGISEEQRGEALRWAEMAADRVDVLAMRKWAQELKKQGRAQESFELLDSLWRAGDASAAMALAIFYQDDVPAFFGGNQNYVRAYAFHLIRNKLYEAASQGSVSPNRANRLAAQEAALQSIGARLTPQGQQAAEALAVQLLVENTNCCLGTWR
jgi:hypothetical protein